MLILDEPTVGLDPTQIIRIRETIRSLGRERAVLLSTHILPEVDAVCDRVLIIDRGRIVAEGTPEELRRRLAGTPTVRAIFRGTVAARDGLAALPGVLEVEESASDGETRVKVHGAPDSNLAEEIFQLAVARGWVLRELARDAVTLEDVFVRLTHHDDAAAVAADAPEEPAAPVASPS